MLESNNQYHASQTLILSIFLSCLHTYFFPNFKLKFCLQNFVPVQQTKSYVHNSGYYQPFILLKYAKESTKFGLISMFYMKQILLSHKKHFIFLHTKNLKTCILVQTDFHVLQWFFSDLLQHKQQTKSRWCWQ